MPLSEDQQRRVNEITAKAIGIMRIPASTTDVLVAAREAVRIGVAVCYDELVGPKEPEKPLPDDVAAVVAKHQASTSET